LRRGSARRAKPTLVLRVRDANLLVRGMGGGA